MIETGISCSPPQCLASLKGAHHPKLLVWNSKPPENMWAGIKSASRAHLTSCRGKLFVITAYAHDPSFCMFGRVGRKKYMSLLSLSGSAVSATTFLSCLHPHVRKLQSSCVCSCLKKFIPEQKTKTHPKRNYISHGQTSSYEAE